MTRFPEGAVLDARTVSPRFPGIGRYVLGLLKGLAPDRPALVTSPSPDPRLPRDRMRPVAASPFDLRQQWEVRRAIREAGGRVYHSPYYLMPLRPGVPTILNGWDLTPLTVPGLFGPASRLAFRVAHLLALRTAHRVIVPTRAVYEDFRRFFPHDQSKTVVIPPGADFENAVGDEEAATARARLGIAPRYLLYAGSNKPHKNLPVLIDAWAAALRRSPTPLATQLVVAGPGDARFPRAASLAEVRGVGRHVRELGHVDDAMLAALYAGATLFVFPSRAEGFGLPVVEAMARGVPVICSRVPALLEVTAGAAATCGADDAEALGALIARLLEDESERERLGRAGIARASDFTWKAAARQTTELYALASGGR